MGDIWTLLQDNALIHTVAHTTSWFEANDVDILEQPARSPDLNITENVWEEVARKVYKDRKRYENVKEHGEAVFNCFMNLFSEYIRNVYHSLLKRCLIVIQKMGAMIDQQRSVVVVQFH